MQTLFDMADLTGRKKGLPQELGYEDMKDYIHREMAVEFDAMMARDRWVDVSLKRQVEEVMAGLEHDGEQAIAKEALHANREIKTAGFKKDSKSGLGMGQEMPVILL